MSYEPHTVVFTGTFDPPTNGHLDIIRRSRRLFDKTIVAIGRNPEKSPLLTEDERVEMLRELLEDAPDVEVEAYSGLTIGYVRSKNADAIVKGIRDGDDLRYELQQANLNMMIGNIETVFLFTTDQTALISSTLIRQIAELGGLESDQIGRLIPQPVLKRLREKMATVSA